MQATLELKEWKGSIIGYYDTIPVIRVFDHRGTLMVEDLIKRGFAIQGKTFEEGLQISARLQTIPDCARPRVAWPNSTLPSNSSGDVMTEVILNNCWLQGSNYNVKPFSIYFYSVSAGSSRTVLGGENCHRFKWIVWEIFWPFAQDTTSKTHFAVRRAEGSLWYPPSAVALQVN